MNEDNDEVADNGGYYDSLPSTKQSELPALSANGFEILCHNLSHSDFVLSINDCSMSGPNGRIIARPGFSRFREISRNVVRGIGNQDLSLIPTMLYPKCSRLKNRNSGPNECLEIYFILIPLSIFRNLSLNQRVLH